MFDKYNLDDLFNIKEDNTPDTFYENVCNMMSDKNIKIINPQTTNNDIVSELFPMVCFNHARQNINDITESLDEWEMYNTLMAPTYVYTFLPGHKHRLKATIEKKALLALSNKDILNKFIAKCCKRYSSVNLQCHYMHFNSMFWIKMVLYGIVESKNKSHFSVMHGCCIKESKFIELLCDVVITELSGNHFIHYSNKLNKDELFF